MTEGQSGTLPAAGRVIMVSGANRGIGLAIARRLHGDGYCVSLGARDTGALLRAAAPFEDSRVLCCRFDARERASAAAWVEETASRMGRIDGVVNNAGVLHLAGFEELDEDSLDEQWEVNVKAPYRLIVAALPHLRRTGAGRIVNVVSMSGLRFTPGGVGYVMTKHAVLALSHAARHHLFNDGIRVTALCPGSTRTDMTARLPAEADLTQPETLAAIVSLVISLPNSATVATLPVNWQYEVVA
ncbi:MAG: SDR family oxidoreductase [Alphaproteobacteria bacterium]